MIRRLLTYIITLAIMTGCSDGLDIPSVVPDFRDGVVEINLNIPAPVTVASRTDGIEVDPEFEVDHVDIFVFEGEDADQASVQHVRAILGTDDGDTKLEQVTATQLKLSFRLKKELRDKTDLHFYVIANNNGELSDDETVSKLKTEPVADLTDDDGRLTMCGTASYTAIRSNPVIGLYRNAAKATVSSKIPGSEGTDFYRLEVFGTATATPLLAGKTGASSDFRPVGTMPESIDSQTDIYFHPTRNEEASDKVGGRIFVITQAPYNGSLYYYRLDFVQKDSATGQPVYISTFPNHWYQFIITEITAPGYDTPEEASCHPENGIKYEIHDHCTESYNMTSDGYRELGVSHTIEYETKENDENPTADKFLYIKLFSPKESEYPLTTDEVFNLVDIENPEWLECSAPELVTDEAITSGQSIDGDPNHEGRVYRMKLTFKPTSEIGTLYNTIKVEWRGLKREVSVLWLRDFNGANVSTVSLTMRYNGDTTIDDYWKFLSSTDDAENPAYPDGGNLWGIQPTLNNGNVRNQGFHFPVMYGTGTDDLATYIYNLTFNKSDKFRKDNVTNVEVSRSDSNIEWSETNENGEYYSYKIERGNSDRYKYLVGNIAFTFSFKDNTREVYSFKTYHTGFFHKENADLSRYQLDGPKDYVNYFYYEVKPVTVDGSNRYILDRNLSAKSAQDYIRDSDGSAVIGNPEAAGGYYVIAQQGDIYEDPVTIENLTPPGYRVPMKNVWDAVRLSSSFHIENDGRYYPAYYDTGSPLTGKIYFPKAMLYCEDNGGITGESRSGYYWTLTPASGTEKEEIGRWLQMLVLTGGTTTFTNGYVLAKSGDTYQWSMAYGGSVRCIDDRSDESTVYRTHFNVNGATHVYLYSVEDGVPTPTTTWPGHPIGNYATMNNDYNWFGFTYSSTQFRPENLYVIFNFVDVNGIIHTYSQDSEGKTIKTDKVNPTKIKGWKVVGDKNSYLKSSSDFTIDGGKTLHPADVTALGNWWRCGGDDTSPYVYNYYLDR